MASVLKVDKLDPQSGTALELGTSGDTVSIPSGATLDISASTLTPPATMPASSGINFTALNATNLGSGTVPTARLGTGTASSSTILYGDNTWAAAGGIAYISSWRLHTTFAGGANPITSNFEEIDAPVGFTVLGSSMTESSGVFTFPATGYWLIMYSAVMSGAYATQWCGIGISTTIDNSSGPTWAYAADGNSSSSTSAGLYNGASTSYVFDVTDTAECKVRFYFSVQNASKSMDGNTNVNSTFMNFIKLADT